VGGAESRHAAVKGDRGDDAPAPAPTPDAAPTPTPTPTPIPVAAASGDDPLAENLFDPTRRALGAWLWRIPVLLAGAGVIVGGVQAYRIHFAKGEPPAIPTFEDRPPVAIAPLAAFDAPYAAVEFFLGGVPCLAVRVPEPVAGGATWGERNVIGFSRMCTHQACLVDLNRDVEAVAFAFNHRSDRPSLTCSCHYSVFDPLRAGRAVSGPAVLPLQRVRLRLDGDVVAADGIERSA
jgi:arsenite oxidase small subunit